MAPALRVIRFVPALLWAGVLFWLSAQPDPPGPSLSFSGSDKLVHAGVYGCLALLLLFADRGRRPILWVIVAIAYGATDEIHQAFVPPRQADLLDLLADAAGAVLAVALWLRWRRSSPARMSGPSSVHPEPFSRPARE